MRTTSPDRLERPASSFGVPAVVNVAGAFDKITEGADILVDGDKGIVTQPMG